MSPAAFAAGADRVRPSSSRASLARRTADVRHLPRTEELLLLSSLISRASAALLLVAGIVLLFASDDVLPRLVSGFPESGAWVGQLLAAALLALGATNWLSRSQLLGGIYGRPVVMANAVFYFVAAMVTLRAAASGDVANSLWVVAAVVSLLAVVYGWLLFRGPLERDFQASRGSSPST